MSTELQKELAEAIVINKSLPVYKRKNKTDLLVSTGYSPKTASTEAKQILESKGVKDALRDMGLTEELVITALVEDIKNKPSKRFLELSLGAEILGMKQHDKKNMNQANLVFLPSELMNKYNLGDTV